jgi:hypothetical protein
VDFITGKTYESQNKPALRRAVSERSPAALVAQQESSASRRFMGDSIPNSAMTRSPSSLGQ